MVQEPIVPAPGLSGNKTRTVKKNVAEGAHAKLTWRQPGKCAAAPQTRRLALPWLRTDVSIPAARFPPSP